jgi:hypothetical protein
LQQLDGTAHAEALDVRADERSQSEQWEKMERPSLAAPDIADDSKEAIKKRKHLRRVLKN